MTYCRKRVEYMHVHCTYKKEAIKQKGKDIPLRREADKHMLIATMMMMLALVNRQLLQCWHYAYLLDDYVTFQSNHHHYHHHRSSVQPALASCHFSQIFTFLPVLSTPSASFNQLYHAFSYCYGGIR